MHRKAGRIAAAILCLASHASMMEARGQESVDFETYRVRSRKELVMRLEGHASFCRGKRAFDEYGKTLELILTFDPQNATALKGLGFRKKGREWVPPKKPKSFENKNLKVLEQVDSRFREAVAPFLETHTEWVQVGQLSDEERRDALTDILRLDPTSPVVSNATVELRAAAAGVLPETLIAKDRRAQMNLWVREGFKQAPAARQAELLDRDDALGVAWRGVLETEEFRVVYATDAEEADRLLYALHATDSLFKSLFHRRRGLPRGLTVYLMETPADRDAFLGNHPSVSEETGALLARLGGSGIPGTRDFAFWEGDSQRRADGIVRMALGWMFKGGYNISVETGWAYEGLGLYLTRKLVRTRQNWTASVDSAASPKQDFQLRTRLLQENTNWMQEAYEMWQSAPPDFKVVMGRNVNQLSLEDILASYVLAAYLLEGQPEKVDALLRLTGSRLSVTEQVQRVFGWDLPTLQARVGRWLSERH